MFIKIKKLCSIFHKPFWGSFGYKTFLVKPIMIKDRKHIYLGKSVCFRNGARIENIRKWKDQSFDSSIKIGDFTSFEQGAHITNAGHIEIGKHCTFTPRVMITTINHDYSVVDRDISDSPLIVKDVKIGDFCFFGMDVKIFPGVKIGNNVIVGANSIVMNDLPDYSVCVGVPAKPIKKYNFETKKWEAIKD